jgi:hypothetical protein
MRVAVLVLILSALAFAQSLVPQGASAAKELISETPNPAGFAAPVNLAPDLPPVPRGKTTVIGGAIRSVDHLRDELVLNIYGGHPIRVFFDQRTRIYRNGQPAELSDLHPGERVSVETQLDGEDIFARSIHSVSQSVDGQCHGQVLSFDAAKRELLIRDGLAPQPIRVEVPANISIVGEGQQAASPAALAPGALVAITFRSDGNGHAVANQVSMLAAPGSAFVFTGVVTYLDVHDGVLSLLDPVNQKRYEISFDPQSSVRASLHEGLNVTVNAGFDGRHYTARTITLNKPAAGAATPQ